MADTRPDEQDLGRHGGAVPGGTAAQEPTPRGGGGGVGTGARIPEAATPSLGADIDIVLRLLWTCENCGWTCAMDAPGFAGDGVWHYPDGSTPCGPITAMKMRSGTTETAEPSTPEVASSAAGRMADTRPDEQDLGRHGSAVPGGTAATSRALEYGHRVKLYISGPMSGLPEFNYPAFHAAKESLLALGYDVISPADLPLRDDWEWVDYMEPNIRSVFEVDGIATLDGWQASKGARIECRIATERGIAVHPLADWVPFAAVESHGGTTPPALQREAPESTAGRMADSDEQRLKNLGIRKSGTMRGFAPNFPTPPPVTAGRMADRPGEAGQGEDLGRRGYPASSGTAATIREQLEHLGPWRAQVGIEALDRLEREKDEAWTAAARQRKTVSDYEQAREVAHADADYVLRWLQQTEAPANIIGLQTRVRAALSGSAGPDEQREDGDASGVVAEDSGPSGGSDEPCEFCGDGPCPHGCAGTSEVAW